VTTIQSKKKEEGGKEKFLACPKIKQAKMSSVDKGTRENQNIERKPKNGWRGIEGGPHVAN